MIPILPMLAGLGIDFIKDLITDNGETLVKEGIKKVTGIDLDKKKEITPQDASKIKEYELQLKALDFEALKLELEGIKEVNRNDETNRALSHNTYQIKHEMADVIAKQIIDRNLPIIAILVAINVSLVYFLKDNASLIAIASNIIGLAIGNLFNERQAIVNFFFGSSIGSKLKDTK